MYELNNIATDNSEVFTGIMLHLNPQELAQLSLVNHAFHASTQNEVLWKLKFKQHFPDDFPTSVPNDLDWKKAFIKRYKNALCTSDYLREKIPDELLLKILGYLTPKNILTSVTPLAQSFTDFSHDTLLWQQLFMEHFPEKRPLFPTENYDWLNAFKGQYREKYKSVKITTITSIIRNEIETIKATNLSIDELEANNFLLIKSALKNQSQACLDHFFALAEAQLETTNKTPLLHWMVLCNQIDKIKTYNGELNTQNPAGQTALMLAVENNLFQIFDHLLNQNTIDLRLTDATHKSVLDYVLNQDNSHRLMVLLQRMGSIIAQKHNQQTTGQALDAAQRKFAISQELHQFITPAMFLSIKVGAFNCFNFLLNTPSLKMRTPVIFNQAIVLTINYGRVEMLSTLLKLSLSNNVAWPKALDISMERAARYGQYEIVKYLSTFRSQLLSQRKENQESDSVDEKKKTDLLPLSLRCKLLELAALNGHLAFIQSLFTDNVINLAIEEEQLAAIEVLKKPELWLKDKINVIEYLITKKLINPTLTAENTLQRSFAAALQRNQSEFCEFLLHHTQVNSETVSPQLYIATFFQALKRNNITFIKFLVLRAFIDINQKITIQLGMPPNQTQLSKTSLHIATQLNHLELMAYLLDNGCDINALDSNNKTALHYAITFKRANALELLLQRGADPTAGISPIHAAICANFPEGLVILLQTAPEILTRSELIMATTLGATSCVEILLNHGAKIDSCIFQMAVERKYLSIVQLFLEATQNPIHFVNAEFFWSCHQNKAMFKLLAQHGVSPIAYIEQCIAQKKSMKDTKQLLALNDQLNLPKIDLNQLLEQAKMVNNHHAIKYLQKELVSEHAAKKGGISYQFQQLKEKAAELGFRNGKKISTKKTVLDKKIHLARSINYDPCYQVLNYEQTLLIYTTYEDAYRQGHVHGLAKRKQGLTQDENKSIDERAAKRKKITPDNLPTTKRKTPEESSEEKTKARKHRKLENAPEQTQPIEEKLATDNTANARADRSTYSPSFFSARIKEEKSTDMDAVNGQEPKSPPR